MKMTLKLLNTYRDEMTQQQYRTLRGQCISGDIDGCIKGMYKILNRKRK